MRVLIIEDEKVIAMDIKWILEKSGYQVIGIYPSGEDAISMAVKESPDLILMDIILQGSMDGIEAAKTIFELKQTPILFCTANYDKITKEKMKLLDHAGVLGKPLDDGELLNRIKLIQEERSKAV